MPCNGKSFSFCSFQSISFLFFSFFLRVWTQQFVFIFCLFCFLFTICKWVKTHVVNMFFFRFVMLSAAAQIVSFMMMFDTKLYRYRVCACNKNTMWCMYRLSEVTSMNGILSIHPPWMCLVIVVERMAHEKRKPSDV